MITSRTLSVATLLVLALPLARAHGPVPRVSDSVATEARLFASDSATGQVMAIELPSGEVRTRLATPPYILTMGRSRDGRHVFAMRGRDTDRDTVTVIDTGIAPGVAGARAPAIVRTFTGRAPGGVHDGYLSTVGGQDALFNEEVAELVVFGSSEFGGLDAVPQRTIKLAAPDHYHYLEAGRFLYVGHLAKSMVQVIDRETGAEAARIGNCPILHGMAADETSGRLFFACMRHVLVVGTRGDEANREVARIPYPGPQRIGIFVHGRGRVLWGTTEGQNPAVLRLDAAREPYAFESVPVDSVIQRGTTPDGDLLLYSRNGHLDIRDGSSGALLRRVDISRPFTAEYHEHVDKALLPDIVARGRLAYVSIPPEGVIVEVDLDRGSVLRRLETGGQPTRIVVVEATAPPPAAK